MTRFSIEFPGFHSPLLPAATPASHPADIIMRHMSHSLLPAPFPAAPPTHHFPNRRWRSSTSPSARRTRRRLAPPPPPLTPPSRPSRPPSCKASHRVGRRRPEGRLPVSSGKTLGVAALAVWRGGEMGFGSAVCRIRSLMILSCPSVPLFLGSLLAPFRCRVPLLSTVIVCSNGV